MSIQLEELYSLVTNSKISPDAWEDDVKFYCIGLVEDIKHSGHLEDCLKMLETLEEPAAVRLLQVITSCPSLEIFQSLVDLFPQSSVARAEVLFDGLRCWSLNEEQQQQLLLSSKPFRGKWSILLDKIIDKNLF